MLDARDPYLEDRRKLDLAWRLLRHGARTQTISRWTGLSARRVRSLLKKYRSRSAELNIQRPRGDSPFNVELLLRSPRRRLEAASFAAVHQGLRQKVGAPEPGSKPDLGSGELVCMAYETFREREPQSALSIDQAFLVLSTLSRNVEFALGRCPICNAPIFIDRLSVATRRCGNCATSINTSAHSADIVPAEPACSRGS